MVLILVYFVCLMLHTAQAADALPDEAVLELAMRAYQHAEEQGLVKRKRITIVDYSRPSTEKRLWVLDATNQRILLSALVTHGKNSGKLTPYYFSNQPNSHQSSLGALITDKAYYGKHGYSLRLKGLEPGINDKAWLRNIVIHGATYATEKFAQSYGYLGRSFGCLAVSPKLNRRLIDATKGGSLVFVYSPRADWLTHSEFLS